MSATAASPAPAAPSDPSASRDGSAVVVGVVSQPTEPPYLVGDETCAMTSVVPAQYPSHCRRTRSCRSCLQKAGCMIDQYGACVDQRTGKSSTAANYSKAYALGLVLPNVSHSNHRLALPSPAQFWSFRSSEATYCATSDPVCQQCIENNFWSPASRPDSRFCEGENACVCIWDCEARWYTPEGQCISATPSQLPSAVFEPMSKSLDSVVKFMILGMCVILLLFAVCLFRCIRKDYDTRQRREQQQRARRAA